MKKTLTALALTALFAACSSKPKAETDGASIAMQADTASMNHNSFTDKGAVMTLNGVSDTIVGADGANYIKAGTNIPNVTQPKRAVATTKTSRTHSTTHKSTGSPASTASNGTGNTTASSTGSGTSSSTGTEATAPVVAKKKGWSNTLKGAVIGAGTGAAAGAIISKNKVKGAIIGGVAGAGGGFIVGKILDKKADKNP
jgi:hypothetical protein